MALPDTATTSKWVDLVTVREKTLLCRAGYSLNFTTHFSLILLYKLIVVCRYF